MISHSQILVPPLRHSPALRPGWHGRTATDDHWSCWPKLILIFDRCGFVLYVEHGQREHLRTTEFVRPVSHTDGTRMQKQKQKKFWAALGCRCGLGTQSLSPFMISLSGWSWLLLPPWNPKPVSLHDFPSGLLLAAAAALEPKASLPS